MATTAIWLFSDDRLFTAGSMDESGSVTEAFESGAAGVGGQTASGSDSSPASAPSVLQQVRQKTQRKRRRGQPPGWTLWLAGKASQSGGMITHTLPVWLMEHRHQFLTLAVSFIFHLALAFVMALWVMPPDAAEQLYGLIVTRVDADAEAPLEVIEIEAILQPDSLQDLDTNSNMKELISELDNELRNDLSIDTQDRDFTLELEPTDAEMKVLYKQGEFGGRSEAGKRAAVKKYGGTVDSEKAVVSGLKWLQKIQRKDGSWSFAAQGPGAVVGRFRKTEVGATSLALLCFLGAGHTHAQDGPYRETVVNGLEFIAANATVTQGTADLRGESEGNAGMYVQGLATICLSEAHALEHNDKNLTKLTEMAVRFIERAQNPITGGWRYKPRDDTSDTSVVGWEVMALQSAKSGRIRVSSKSLRLAREFLRSAQADDEGSLYAYVPGNAAKPSMTAVGLLCRMYLGWRNDNPALKKGVQYLAGRGPNRNDMYYNYYATQVLHHWGGALWKTWNQELREHLVRSQITDGPAAGSWRPVGPHSDTGGQLYQTTLSILTLEVYYRHLPIYQRLQQEPSDPTVLE
ncbi:MAG: terpene cyclase/mutase family protein [Fuerstiella sp.]|nr:terpene cyclase/mutase family protein [Fuerstiella sp.]